MCLLRGKKGLLYELACISSSRESKQTMQGKLKVLRLFRLVEKKRMSQLSNF